MSHATKMKTRWEELYPVTHPRPNSHGDFPEKAAHVLIILQFQILLSEHRVRRILT